MLVCSAGTKGNICHGSMDVVYDYLMYVGEWRWFITPLHHIWKKNLHTYSSANSAHVENVLSFKATRN